MEDALMSDSEAAERRTPPVVVINTFTPRPGALEEFLAAQTAALPALAAQARGWRGTRLYRTDAEQVVMVSVFATSEDFERFGASEAFAAHRARVLPLLESASPARGEPVYGAGTV
jgi:heme-degrading monooxygenase HmoA